MENIYNQYTSYIRQSVTNLGNQQLLNDLRPRFETLKQKVNTNEYLLQSYKGIKNSVIQEIDNNISDSYALDSFISHFDTAVYNINQVTREITYLLQQPNLSKNLRSRISNFQNDCYRSLNLYNTENAINQISEFKRTFQEEERIRKEKQKKLIINILKWLGIAIGVGIVIWIIASYWQVILGIIVIGGIIAYFASK